MDIRLRTNSVIQISPTHPATEYHHQFGMIKDVFKWGVMVYVYLDNEWGLVGVQEGNFYYVGEPIFCFTDDEVQKCKCSGFIPIEGADAFIVCGKCNLKV